MVQLASSKLHVVLKSSTISITQVSTNQSNKQQIYDTLMDSNSNDIILIDDSVFIYVDPAQSSMMEH